MAWQRPTLKLLVERISRDFSGHLLDGGSLLARSVLGVFAKVWAGACHLMHGFFEWSFKQIFVYSAETVYLEKWAWVWNIERKPASKATGQVTFFGAEGAAGAVIPAGTLLQYQSTGVQYKTTHDATLVEGGKAIVSVEALEAGSAGGLASGVALALVSPLVGVRSTVSVSGEGVSGGADEESDDSLRERLLSRLRQPPRGGASHDYIFWAKEVPGVTRAWCYPMGLGIGTVSLTFLTEGVPVAQGGPFPSAAMVARVQAHISALCPATVKEFSAFAPDPLPYTVRVRLTPDTLSVREAVVKELHDLHAREAAPGATLYRSHIAEAISYAAGEEDHTLFEPVGDVVVPEGYFPVLQEVIFEGAL